MPVCHGSYIREKPMMHEKDCKVGLNANIAPFGACFSPGNTNKKIIINDAQRAMPAGFDDNDNPIPQPMPIEGGRLCVPMLGDKWCDAKEDTLVDGVPALTVECTLTCSIGGEDGVVRFWDDGQGV